MPDQDCDAACQKIIINGGFMAALAPKAAKLWPDGAIGHAAKELAEAAQLQREMFKVRGLTAEHTDSFDGCAEARMLVAWIRNHGTDAAPRGPEAVKLMNSWTETIWQQIANLVAGNWPDSNVHPVQPMVP